MSKINDGFSESSLNLNNIGPAVSTNLPNVFIPSGLTQQVSLGQLKGPMVTLPGPVPSPDVLSDISLPVPVPSTVQAPMVSLTDPERNQREAENTQIGRQVPTIDPKIVSDRIRKFNISNAGIASISPKYSKTPPIGSILQTPPDLTPTQVASQSPKVYVNDLGTGSLAPETTPAISQPIYDFIHNVPNRPSLPQEENNVEHPQETTDKTNSDLIDDAKKRADYRVKFGILREAYPNMNIPEPSESTPIEQIEAEYKEYVKRIHVESSVEQNKIYLLILWLLIDVIGTRFFRLPFNGRYVKSQFKYMQKYQMLLIELGERSYSESGGEGWPVEFRLLAMAIFHGVIFALVQLLASKLGGVGAANEQMADQLRDVIDNFLTQNRSADVLRRAEQASSDRPIPIPVTENPAPPMGDLGAMIGNFAPMLMGLFGGGGGGNTSSPSATEEKPKMKRPTTFGARHRRNQNTTNNV